ncbi:MAG TPA: hypothetical protein VGD43_18095, partial [Micromonospora sp.]
NRAARMAESVRAWAGCFRWDRTADLLAGVVAARLAEIPGRAGTARRGAAAERRTSRPHVSAVVTFRPPAEGTLRLRATDEVRADGVPGVDGTAGDQVALLHGCDEAAACTALRRQGARVTSVRLATDLDLLVGPPGEPPTPPTPPMPATEQPVELAPLDRPVATDLWPTPPPPVADGLNGLVHQS